MQRREFITLLGSAAVEVGEVWCIGHEAARLDKLPRRLHRRQSRAQRQGVDAIHVGGDKRIAADIKCLCLALECIERRHNVLVPTNSGRNRLKPERAGCCLSLAHLQDGKGIADVGYDRQPAQTRDNIAQKFSPLAGDICQLGRQAREIAARSRQTGDQPTAERVI